MSAPASMPGAGGSDAPTGATPVPVGTPLILPDLEQGSEEWFAQRRGMVTASVVGQLVSVGYMGPEAFNCPDCDAESHTPCRSKVKRAGEYGPIKTFHNARADVAESSRSDEFRVISPAHNDTSRGLTRLLTAERITGYTEPTYTSDDMMRGILDEPIARDLYSQHYAPVTECGFMIREFNGCKLGFSPDGLVGDDGLIEIKSRRQKAHLATILADAVPSENMAQLQAGLLVSGRKWIDYISYCGGMPMWRKRVRPDPRWFAAIEDAVEQFENAATQMIETYAAATEGLPATERVVELEMVI